MSHGLFFALYKFRKGGTSEPEILETVGNNDLRCIIRDMQLEIMEKKDFQGPGIVGELRQSLGSPGGVYRE